MFGAVYFLVEPVGMYWHSREFFGSPVGTVLALYLMFGMVFGLATSVIVWLAGFVGKTPGRKPVPDIVAGVGFLFTVLFLLRRSTVAGLTNLEPSAMISVVSSAMVWGGILVLYNRRFGSKAPESAGGTSSWPTMAAAAIVLITIVLASVSQSMATKLPGRDAESRDLPNIVLILVDALRPDHLGAYGYDRETSPTLDRLADEGVVFENAYSHGNRTILAMPALFTSIYTPFHGAVGFRDNVRPLPQKHTTMTEMLRDAGYTTVGLMSNVYLKRPFGMTQGFDKVEEFNAVRFRFTVYRLLKVAGLVQPPPYAAETAPHAPVVTDAAIDWMNRVDESRPFFLYVHYMDVHHEYRPPQNYQDMFDSSPESAAVDSRQLFLKTANLVAVSRNIRLPEVELTRLVDLYDACIRFTDDEMGRLVEAIKDLPSDRETIVIFTSDHGDEFGAHGSLYHTNFVIEELIRVPLVMWSTGDRIGPRRVEPMVRHLDLLPTVAHKLGLDVPRGAEGSSLLPLMDGTGEVEIRETLAKGDFSMGLRYDDWKIMYVDSTDAYYLYDLSEDPDGFVDVSQRYPDVFLEMRTRIDEYISRADQLDLDNAAPTSKEVLRQLEALGYL